MANKWNLEGVAVDTDDNATFTGSVTASGGVVFPTADPLVAGVWWDDDGTLTKSTGA